jgi:hypothetical protein
MAVTQKNNRILVTADNDTFTGPLCIECIRIIAGTTSPSVQLKETNTSGAVLWESGTLSDNAVQESVPELRIDAGQTVHVDLAGTGTKLYIYVE